MEGKVLAGVLEHPYAVSPYFGSKQLQGCPGYASVTFMGMLIRGQEKGDARKERQ